MNKHACAQALTVQARIPRDAAPEAVAVLDAYGALFSRMERVAVATFTRGEKLDKNAFPKAHGVTGRQFNAIKRSAEGKVQSQLSNLEKYVRDYQAKTAAMQRRIAQKQALAGRTLNSDKAERLR